MRQILNNGYVSRRIRLTLLVVVCGFGLSAFSLVRYRSAKSSETATALSAEDQSALRVAIASGNLPDLRWSDFSDYRKHVEKFYEFRGNSLWWTKGSEPTPQARQLIAILLQADQKGLSADDYDGPRWNDRLARLKPASRQPNEADAAKFDLALTVCAMRYISDLHMGKVNPKHFAFALGDESREYDLAEFLKDHIVNARDIAGALTQVEPQYPGYRRTMRALQTYLELAKKDDGEQLPATKKPVVPGDTYPSVPRLTRLLRLVGDLPADANVPADQSLYSGTLVDGVKNFQRRHGRDPNGKIDATTLADLNVPPSRRVRQMQLTLERLALAAGLLPKIPDRGQHPRIPPARLRQRLQDLGNDERSGR